MHLNGACGGSAWSNSSEFDKQNICSCSCSSGSVEDKKIDTMSVKFEK